MAGRIGTVTVFLASVVVCAVLIACEKPTAVGQSPPVAVTSAGLPTFKILVVNTNIGSGKNSKTDGYAEASPDFPGYRLHSAQAHSEGTDGWSRQWVTFIYVKNDDPLEPEGAPK